MTPALRKHLVSCMTILFISANQQIGHQVAHKVGCQAGDFAYGHFNLPPGFVWVYMGSISFCFEVL